MDEPQDDLMTYILDSDDDTCDSHAVSRPSTSKKCPP